MHRRKRILPGALRRGGAAALAAGGLALAASGCGGDERSQPAAPDTPPDPERAAEAPEPAFLPARYLNRGASRGETRVRIAFVPVPFEELIPALREGRGDLAAAFLTITPEREKAVAIASGRGLVVNEIVVAHEGATGLARVEDLAGRRVHVLRGSSYAEHLRALNARLRAAGRPPVDVQEAAPELVTEDLLELVNAGVFEITVADDFRARLWSGCCRT
jgi:ABC-type amino acid transport substrate-binding protein